MLSKDIFELLWGVGVNHPRHMQLVILDKKLGCVDGILVNYEK
jgi:hypothetical protein